MVPKGDRHETRVFHLPAARFDNRKDLTTFVREPRDQWKPADVQAIHSELRAAFGRMTKN